MKILITSGGTKVPIDTVRDITNMSRGTFGSKLAHEALLMGCGVIFLRAKGSKSPFTWNIDLGSEEFDTRKLEELLDLKNKYRDNFVDRRYRDYDDYADELESLLKDWRPDAVVLAAAVSDYGVDAIPGKARSSDEMTIQLKPLPKLIRRVKEWSPTTFLVGFKLMVDVSKTELFETAMRSIHENHCDMVVGNDLKDLQAGTHDVMLVRPGDTGFLVHHANPYDPNHIARTVMHEVYKAVSARKMERK